MLKDYFLPAPKNSGFRMEGYYIWCGSVVKGDDSKYYMFASRVPKTQDFHPGWLLLSEIVRAVSDTPWGPFEFQEVVMTDRGGQFWDGRMVHNPRIIPYEGKFLLYYVGTTFAFPVPDDERILHEDPRTMTARANKRVGIAISDSITGKFERLDSPILQTRPHFYDNLLTSNPSPLVEEDGSVLVMYKSRHYNAKPYKNPTHSNMEFGLARAKTAYSEYERLTDTPMFPPEVHLEDPFIWRDKNGYCMLAKDMEGNLSQVKGEGIYATSQNALDWEIQKGESAYTKIVTWDDGTTSYYGNMERPCLLFEDGVATCAYFAVSNGAHDVKGVTETFNLAIPLKPGITSL